MPVASVLKLAKETFAHFELQEGVEGSIEFKTCPDFEGSRIKAASFDGISETMV
jgi:hypothetical protein